MERGANLYRWFLILGLVGAFCLMVQSVVGVLVWPGYNPIKVPLEILTLPGTPYAQQFSWYLIVAQFFIFSALLTIWRIHVLNDESGLSLASAALSIIWALGCIMQSFWPESVSGTYILDIGLAISFMLFLAVFAGTIWTYGRLAQNSGRPSLAVAVHLFSGLYVIFMMVSWSTVIFDWPFLGLFDILATDSLAMCFGMMSFYYLKYR